MKNIINSELRNEIVRRVRKLESGGDGMPGKLRAEDLLSKTLSLVKIPHKGVNNTRGAKGFCNRILKKLVLAGVAIPDSVAGGDFGVNREISGFENMKDQLISLLENFSAKDSPVEYPAHPRLGSMTYKEWGRLTYLFLDHNLRSFGV